MGVPGRGGVASEGADLHPESAPVDQQADEDLRLDAAPLGSPRPPQVVFPLGLELEGGHDVEHQRYGTYAGGEGVRGTASGVAPVAFDAARERAPHGAQ